MILIERQKNILNSDQLQQSCPDNFVSGVQIIDWNHPKEGSLISITNTSQVAEKYLKPPQGSDPFAISVDGYFSSGFKSPVSPTEEDKKLMREGFQPYKNLFLTGDFMTYFGRDNFLRERKETQTAINATLGTAITVSAGYFIFDSIRKRAREKIMINPRREFLKTVLMIAGTITALPILSAGSQIYQSKLTNDLNACRPDLLSQFYNHYFIDPETADGGYRTGLVAAKLAGIPPDYFEQRGQKISEVKSLWGFNHGFEKSLEFAKDVSSNPGYYSRELIKRDIAYLQELGLNDGDINVLLEDVVLDMASVLPFRVSLDSVGDPALDLLPPDNSGNLRYYDPRILGFPTSGMNENKIKKVVRGELFDLSYDLRHGHATA